MSRVAKQLVYASGFLLVIAGVVFVVYLLWLAPAPSCFDNTQNQGEEAIDCGGPCGPCGIAQAQPLTVRSTSIVKAGNGIGVVAEILNPNTTLSARSFHYTVNVYDDVGNILGTKDGNSFGYAGDVFYIVVPSLNFSITQATGADTIISEVVWDEQKDFSRPKFTVVESNTTKDSFVYVSGKVKNEEASSYDSVEVLALLYTHQNKLVGASRVELGAIEAFGTKDFSIPFPQELQLYIPSFNIVEQSFPRTLQEGDTGQAVTSLQIFLAEQGLLSRDPTGFYDQETTQAVMTLQQSFELEETGMFDEQTRQAVIDLVTGGAQQATQGQEETAVDTAKTKTFIRVR